MKIPQNYELQIAGNGDKKSIVIHKNGSVPLHFDWF